MPNSASSSARAAFVTSLLRSWVRFHRPDVFEAAQKEGLKKFPAKNARQASLPLPESLRNLK